MHGTTRVKKARHVVALIFEMCDTEVNDAGVSWSEVNEKSVAGNKLRRIAQRREPQGAVSKKKKTRAFKGMLSSFRWCIWCDDEEAKNSELKTQRLKTVGLFLLRVLLPLTCLVR